MSSTLEHIEGTLLSDPFPYQSVEEQEEIYVAKFGPVTPLLAGETELRELYLNFGKDNPNLHVGERLTVRGELTERALVTRSGKSRRGSVYQLFVQAWNR